MDIWTIDKAILFATLVLPGFVSIKVYDLVIAGHRRDFSKSLVESVAYSVLNFAVLSWLILIIQAPGFIDRHPVFFALAVFGIFVLFPAIWPFLFIWLSRFDIFKKHLLSPINQPWDVVFSRRKSFWVVVHLRNGKTVRGKYSRQSSASAFPNEKQIYLEEIWLPGKNGGFGKKVGRSQGVLLFENEISYVEFYR